MTKLFFAALGLAGLGVLSASTAAQSAALPTSVATLQSAVTSNVTNVQVRRWGGGGRYWRGGRYWGRPNWGYRPWGWRNGYYWGGVAAGVAAGAAIATAPYYYGTPAPGYYAPAPGSGQCWVTTDDHRGYGYWRPC